MKEYDADRPIDPEEWTALGDRERHELVERYHRRKGFKLPNLRVHAAIHVVVENQLALGSKLPVQKTLMRLMRTGLSRHNAVHAIGSVLAGYIFDLVKDHAECDDVNAAYHRRLEELTAEGWLSEWEQEDSD